MTEADRAAQVARHRALGHRICTAEAPYQTADARVGQRSVHVDAVPVTEETEFTYAPVAGVTTPTGVVLALQ